MVRVACQEDGGLCHRITIGLKTLQYSLHTAGGVGGGAAPFRGSPLDPTPWKA